MARVALQKTVEGGLHGTVAEQRELQAARFAGERRWRGVGGVGPPQNMTVGRQFAGGNLLQVADDDARGGGRVSLMDKELAGHGEGEKGAGRSVPVMV